MRDESLSFRIEHETHVMVKAFAAVHHVAVSDVLRGLCESIARHMKAAAPPSDELVAEWVRDY